jgi:multisubunit Na+/H+ antiporter MnhF subunit
VSVFLVAAVALLLGGVLPGVLAASRGSCGGRFLGYQVVQLGALGVVLCLAAALNRTSYVDVALVLAVLAPAAGFVFTKFFSEGE